MPELVSYRSEMREGHMVQIFDFRQDVNPAQHRRDRALVRRMLLDMRLVTQGRFICEVHWLPPLHPWQPPLVGPIVPETPPRNR